LYDSPSVGSKMIPRLSDSCVIPINSATDSNLIRPPIPKINGHRFQFNSATDSDGIRPPVWVAFVA
jgi:hypothetical protein